jgi:non-ribosomal peptide synthetase component F
MSCNLSETDLAIIASKLQRPYKSEPSLADLNSTLFPTLFARSVAQYPNKLVFIDDTGSHTYTELELHTNAIANRLIQGGVKAGDSIGICCEQGRELLVGIYGILKAGCAYVPIDPDFPAERVLSMIEDAGVQIVLVESTTDIKCQRILACGINLSNVFVINETATGPEANIATPVLSRPVNHLDPFCCIFTSGSTGRPKGIFLNHGQLRYEMEGYNRYISTVPEDQILLSSAVVFDMSLPALYGTIQYGATVFVASREGNVYPTA